MVAVAVLTITMLEVARNYRRSILRDREVEMIHRGEQYERAVKRFYKKNGRYPTSLEQLEDNNKIRYLRKRYKDPMSPDGTWQLVHLADVAKLKGLTTATGAQSSNSANFLSSSGGIGNATGTAAGVAATAAAGVGTNASASASGTTDSSQGTAATGGLHQQHRSQRLNPADGGCWAAEMCTGWSARRRSRDFTPSATSRSTTSGISSTTRLRIPERGC